MSFPSVPQGFYHMLLILTLFFMYTLSKEYNPNLEEMKSNYNNASNEYKIKLITYNHDTSNYIRKRKRLDFEITKIKEMARVVKGIKEASVLIYKIDSIDNLFEENLKNLNESTNIILLAFTKRSDAEKNYLKALSAKIDYNLMVKISYIICFILLILIYREHRFTKLTEAYNLEIRANAFYKDRVFKHCESCARVFTPLLHHGKEKDGLENKGFCIECYNDGEFLNTELTKQDVIDGIKSANPKLKKVEEWVSQLVRWNENPYVDTFKF